MAGVTKYYTFDAELEYAKVFEHNKDEGSEDNDAAKKVLSQGGQYVVNMIVDEDTRQEMVDAGIPEVVMGYQMFHPVEDREGMYRFKAKRPHKNLKLKDKDTGEPVVMGPPNVVDYNATMEKEEAVPWDSGVLIGNGTKAKVKLGVYKDGSKRIVTLQSVGIIELVEYSGGVKW